ncbi:odorant receptor 131-2-like [Lepisosteus oculatus]|uniref:odorant receptor 131-2-like n=1 Tax=Lepisosteus oculatus TaxID=7918 RepID=UPI0003EADFF0|nr:PREDICTED: neuropeptides capa receptor-like [Lepisosteus oculatus]
MGIVQILVVVFLYVNSLLIVTFFKKEAFRTNMRYMFFAHTLVVDCIFLLLTNLVLLWSYFNILITAWSCILVCFIMGILTYATPLTLTAMCLERYVAICMPLRHADISTTSRAISSILIILALSAIPSTLILTILFSSVSLSFYTTRTICTVEITIVHKWQSYLRSAIAQFCFFVMAIIIAFTYLKIMAAAKAASSDNKRLASKGSKTVILHSMQLLLCLTEMLCPFIEMAVYEVNMQLFLDVRYFNYLAFILAPRCLSPLVYGLRDNKFYLVLKYYALFGLNKKYPHTT